MIEEDSRESGAGSRESEKQLFCNVCSHEWAVSPPLRRFRSVDELVRVVGLRRDEVTTLAEVGALNSFGLDRRSALWQAERAVRPAGELFEPVETGYGESAMPQSAMPQSESPIAFQSAIANESSITNRQSAMDRPARCRR